MEQLSDFHRIQGPLLGKRIMPPLLRLNVGFEANGNLFISLTEGFGQASRFGYKAHNRGIMYAVNVRRDWRDW